MKKEDVLNLMNTIPPDLIEEADIQIPANRRLPKLSRTVLIAACLCLALVGTVTAAVKISDIRIAWEDKMGISDSAYTVERTITLFPADRFTQDVAALCQEEPNDSKNFDTWDEMETFIGMELVDNPVLDSAEPGPTWWYARNDKESTTHILLLPVFTRDGKLEIIQGSGSYLIDGVWVTMDESIYTEEAAGGESFYGGEITDDGVHPWYTVVYPKGSEVSEETYTTANGLSAVIVEVVRPQEEYVTYDAFFLINGVSFNVRAGNHLTDLPDDPTHTLEVLKSLLDGFILPE